MTEESATLSPADVAAREAIARARAGLLLGPRDIQAIWQISQPTYSRMCARHEFDRLRTQHPIGNRIYSGVLVARHLDGDTLYEPTFGRKRRP